ncbi:MAG: prephenate/arogenate dehydrogenase [Synechococcales bacterium]|nr:prephenate/arogenate dehydrogenase [Synechococcales bacterium]
MRIGIVGLGLIGGSLGLDLRSLGHYVIGVSQRASTCETAVDRGAADVASCEFTPLETAEVIFICTPLSQIAPTLDQLLPHLAPNAILTDVGSVKAPVIELIQPRWANFVGGHPMAGTAESGINAAIPHLFQHNPYVLTPTPQTPEPAIALIHQLATSLGAKLYTTSPEAHDRAVAWISHLPVMVSASLILACQGEPDPAILSLAQALASSGFRDTSRVGGGNPELGLLMAQFNQAALLEALQAYRHQLDILMDGIKQSDWQEVHQRLSTTQQARPAFVKEPW